MMPVDEAELLALRTAEKAEVVAAIEAVLTVTVAGRDGWRRLHIAQAISWLWRGAYRLARVNASLAMTPATERVVVNDPETESFTTEALQGALAQVEAEPVRLRPALGPIIFTGQ